MSTCRHDELWYAILLIFVVLLLVMVAAVGDIDKVNQRITNLENRK